MTPGPVVSNASPLIGLERIVHLSLLEQLFGRILVPTGVAQEVAPGMILPAWIEQRTLVQPVGPLLLGASLGVGESETIGLALEVSARLVILDDRPARRVAQALRLPVIGTLGILLAAKRKNLLPAIKPCLDALLQHDFRIAPALYEQALADAGEGSA